MTKQINKFMIIRGLLLLIVGLILLVACAPHEDETPTAVTAVSTPVTSPTILAAEPITTTSPNIESTTNAIHSSSSSTPPPPTPSNSSTPIFVTESDITTLIWSPSSDMIYYNGAFGEQFWSFSITDMTATRIDRQDVNFDEPPVANLEELPLYNGDAFPSPSGQTIIYSHRTVIPPTVTPDLEIEGGEPVYPPETFEFWMWKNGETDFLGTILQCGLHDHYWNKNEDKVLIIEFGIPMPRCDNSTISPQAWLFDLQHKEVTPLFSRTDYQPLQVYSFAPDDRFLLYGFFHDIEGANLHLLDVNTFKSIPIEGAIYSFEGWIDENHMLVTLFHGEDAWKGPHSLGLVNIQNSTIMNLTKINPQESVRDVTMSRDNKWIAFTTRPNSDPDATTKLWILKMPPLDG